MNHMAIVGNFQNNGKVTRQQTREAPIVHCGFTRSGTFVYIVHFRLFIQSEPKLAPEFVSSFVEADHFWWIGC